MKEMSKAEFQAEVLKEYAGLVGKGEAQPGVDARAEAERRVRARILSAQQPPPKQENGTTSEENEARKRQIWFEPQEVKLILAVGGVLGIIVGILFAIFVLFIALVNR